MLDSGIREIFAWGLLNHWLWNPEYNARNPNPTDALINVKPAWEGGGGGRKSWGGDLAGLSWPWGRVLDRSCSTGRGNFESFFALRGTDVGIFDCWLGRKRLRPNSHASRIRRTVWKDMEIVEANENKPKWVVLINWTFQDTVVSK